MPELPEVECVKRSLEGKIYEKKVLEAQLSKSSIVRSQAPEAFLARMEGAVFSSVERRGKYLSIRAEKSAVSYFFIVHLGMSGKLLYLKSLDDIEKKYRKHTHLVLRLSDGAILAYNDPRRFGGVRAFAEAEFFSKKLNGGLLSLGPEPFSDGAEGIFAENAKSRGAKSASFPAKEALMDQKIVAGIGNIYACESLWMAGVHPEKPVARMSAEELGRLLERAKEAMALSISLGGSSISDYTDGEGKKGSFQERFAVYGREGEPCPSCASPIEKIKIKGRGTWFCPSCQKQ